MREKRREGFWRGIKIFRRYVGGIIDRIERGVE